MRIIDFITDPKVIVTTLAHLAAKRAEGRSPPAASHNLRPVA